MGIRFPDLLQIAVHRVRDVDRERRDAELVDDELRVLEALRTRGPVGHAHAITFSRPSASAARKAVNAESTPPDRPTSPFLKPRRRSTSSFRKLTSQRLVSSGSMARGSRSGNSTPCKGVALRVIVLGGVAAPLLAGSNFTFSLCFCPLRLFVRTGSAL